MPVLNKVRIFFRIWLTKSPTNQKKPVHKILNVASFSGMPLVWINWKDFFHGEYLAKRRHEIRPKWKIRNIIKKVCSDLNPASYPVQYNKLHVP
jgi:hypothetical protein